MRIITGNTNMDAQKTRLEELEARLHHGDIMIRQLEAQNKPVEHLNNHWLDLLHQYEAECRANQTAA